MIDRVRARDAFVRLRREGVRLRADPLWCSFVPDSQVVPPQVAFAIGRAVGNAVVRNRVRRRLRAILAASTVPPGLYLIGVRSPGDEHTFVQLERAVTMLIAQAASR